MSNLDLQLDRNEKWSALPDPKSGDIILLRDSRNLGHSFKCIVTELGGDNVVARVEAVFTMDGKFHVELGEVTSLVGKELVVERDQIWNVVES